MNTDVDWYGYYSCYSAHSFLHKENQTYNENLFCCTFSYFHSLGPYALNHKSF